MTKSTAMERFTTPLPSGAPPLGLHSTADVVDLARRVRGEYLEMPGLSLTLNQAQRMWHFTKTECERVLDALVASGFLARTRAGTFVRADSGGG